MAFGIYIHYPYCLQQCSYCDFATALHKSLDRDNAYVNSLIKEIQLRAGKWAPNTITSIYFGGGTPSLMQTKHILDVFVALEKQGFKKSADCEVTIEINPDTISGPKLDELVSAGINRFSVGAQTFNDKLLNLVGRKHSGSDTLKTLELLSGKNLNFSVDLLFALPEQTMADVKDDLATLLSFKPSHFSPYILTLPKHHSLQKNRPDDNIQVDMLSYVHKTLHDSSYEQYEISNFSLPGFHSRHNYNAWTGQSYWGLGMSAHSYLNTGDWGVRFWNPATVTSYENQLISKTVMPFDGLPKNQVEILRQHEALTDFNHTRLRLKAGLKWQELERNFGQSIYLSVRSRLEQEKLQNLLSFTPDGVQLNQRGIELSNLVFSEVTFLKEDLP